MTGARLALLAGLAAAAISGCSSKGSAPQRANLRLPSSIAVFHGKTTRDSTKNLPYLAIANEGRNDLSLVDATNDVILDAPVLLRPLAVPFGDRPAVLASAPLGDGTVDVPTPDLLVGVAAGSSVLQVVRTWAPDNGIETAQSVDLGADVLGVVAFPPGTTTAGTARLAVSLAGRKLALVQYRRAAAGDAVERDAGYGTNGVVVHGLDFEPADLAMVPGDGGHLYAATLDPIGPGAVRGVAEIDLLAPADPWPVRALDARAPTRLVAAARLVERSPTSVAKDSTAFDLQPPATRVYAVLDEASCGPRRRIDCGIVTLDPAKTPAVGDDHIPEDWAGWMPYRAPIQVRSRPRVIAVSGPPAHDPTDLNGLYPPGAGFMRLVLGSTATVATTGVGIVAGENGGIDFLDLGRFKVASTTFAPVAAAAVAVQPKPLNRIWIMDPATSTFATSETGSALVHTTPGYAHDEVWTVAYQGALPDLQDRAAEAGFFGTGVPWLAIQVGDGTPGAAGRTLSQVARLYHPALGVKVGDIVTIKVDSLRAAGVTGTCVGLVPPNTPADVEATTPKEFETVVTQLLAPGSEWPGGRVVLALRSRSPDEMLPNDASAVEWQKCWDAFTGALTAPGTGLKNLMVTFRAGGVLLTGNQLGYAGRPAFGVEYSLQYKADGTSPDEDALAAACPLADWDGVFRPLAPPPACDTAACRDTCEQLVLARKARRRYHLAEDCNADATCLARYPGFTFPVVNDPALRFQVGQEVALGDTTGGKLIRGLLALSFSTTSGVSPLTASAGGPTSHANGALPFDRSPWGDVAAGYHFYVSYPGDQVADVSPGVTPVASNTIR